MRGTSHRLMAEITAAVANANTGPLVLAFADDPRNPDNWRPLSGPLREWRRELASEKRRSDLWFLLFVAWIAVIAVAYILSH